MKFTNDKLREIQKAYDKIRKAIEETTGLIL